VKEFEGMTNEAVSLDDLKAARHRMTADLLARLDDKAMRFLLSLRDGEPDFDAIGLPQAAELPAVRWKILTLRNSRRRTPANMPSSVTRSRGFGHSSASFQKVRGVAARCVSARAASILNESVRRDAIIELFVHSTPKSAGKNRSSIWDFDAAGPENEKSCRGRRCGRLFEKNRTTAGRRSAAVPTDVPGRRSGPSETRSSAGGGALLQ
jgi:hypothetical protein